MLLIFKMQAIYLVRPLFLSHSISIRGRWFCLFCIGVARNDFSVDKKIGIFHQILGIINRLTIHAWLSFNHMSPQNGRICGTFM